jgi:hypothetical protein
VSDILQHSPLVMQGEVSGGVDNWADIIKVHLPHQAVDDESYPLGGPGRSITAVFMFIPEGYTPPRKGAIPRCHSRPYVR